MFNRENSAPLLLDVTRLIWRRWEGVRATGIDRICDAWLAQYGPQSQAVIIQNRKQVILSVSASQALFKALRVSDDGNEDIIRVRRQLIGLALRHGAGLLRSCAGKGRFWLNPGHTGLHVPGLASWCQQADVRPIYLVHDLIPITHPQFCREGEAAKHERRMRTVLATAAGVIANSQDTLDRLTEFADREQTALPPAAVAWPGCAAWEPARSDGSSQPASFVVLGTIEGRKNHALLLCVWKRLLARMGQDCPRLIIIGRRGWQADDVFTMLDTYDFKGKVVEAGALDDAELAQVLGTAHALLFPSFTEGFGIPLIEALTARIPVIASNLPVFREIAGDLPELLPPDDESAWLAMIADYAQPDSHRRAHQIDRLKSFKPPNWPGHFARIDAFLGSLGA